MVSDVVGVIVPVHVCDLEIGLVDRGFERHACYR